MHFARDHADATFHVVEIFDGEDIVDSLVPKVSVVDKEKLRCLTCGHKKRSHRDTSEWNLRSPCMHREDSVRCLCRTWNPGEPKLD